MRRLTLRIESLSAMLILVVIGLFYMTPKCLVAQSVPPNESFRLSPKTGFVNAVAVAAPSVVCIQGEKQYEIGVPQTKHLGRTPPASEGVTHIGMGTGIIVDARGYIVTNYHVIKGLLKIQITTSDGTVYRDVEFIRNDLETDLALIKISPTQPLTRIRFGKSKDVDLAEDVIAIGNPFGYQISVSRGIVSGLNRPLKASETLYYENVIQTDTAINPGNSGGPLINIKGEMIGLNAAVREGAENIAFAIPVDTVAQVVERMIRQSVAKMIHHGLTLQSCILVQANEANTKDSLSQENVFSKKSDYLSANAIDSLVIESVMANSPAAKAGLQPGDVILSSNGQCVHSILDFTCSLINVSLADTVQMKVQREGKDFDTTLAFSKMVSMDIPKVGAVEEVLVMKTNRPISSEPLEKAEAAPSYGSSSKVSLFIQNRAPDAAGADDIQEDVVWNCFGLEVETISSEQYQELYPQLTVVSIDHSKIYPTGGLLVANIAEKSPLRTKNEKIAKNDLIFGLVLNDSDDYCWSITSLENLHYVVKKIEELQNGGASVSARIYLIRDNTPYFLDVEFK